MTLTPSDAADASDRDLRHPTQPGDVLLDPETATGATDDPQRGTADPAGGNGSGDEFTRGLRRGRWPSWLAVELTDDGPAPPLLTAVVVLAVVVGVAFRFMTRSHLWLDEALSANIAALPVGEIPEALRHDGHPPLYYVLLHYWGALVDHGDWGVRALSGVLSTLTLPFAYVAGRRLGGRLLGLLALLVFAVSPFAVRYATETRMYSLVMLLVLLGWLLLDDVTRRGRDGAPHLVGLALIVGALLWTHYWAMWLLGGVFIVLLWGWRRANRPEVRRGSGRALLALIAGGLLFVPWLPSMLYQSAHTGTPWAGPVRPTTLLAITLTDFGGGAVGAAFAEPQLLGAILLVFVFLGLFGVARSSRHVDLDLRTTPQFRAEATVVAATLLLAMAVMYVTHSAFASRYASAFLPLVLLMVAGGLSRLRDLRILGAALVMVLALSGLGMAYNFRTDRSQAAVNAAQVAAHGHEGDLILYCPDQLGPAASRVMPPGYEQLAFPHQPGDGWPTDRVDWVDYKGRNSIDPRAYAHQIAEHAAGRGVFVMFSGSYITHESVCENLVDEMSKIRGQAEMLSMADGSRYFENSGLFYFPGPSR